MHFYKIEFIMTVGCDMTPEEIRNTIMIMLARNGMHEQTERTVRVRRATEGQYAKAASQS